MRVPDRFALAADRVRYVGEPVAFVVAETEQGAWDAAEQVLVAYDGLPCVVEAEAALADGAPLVWDDVPGNCAFVFERATAPPCRRVSPAPRMWRRWCWSITG